MLDWLRFYSPFRQTSWFACRLTLDEYASYFQQFLEQSKAAKGNKPLSGWLKDDLFEVSLSPHRAQVFNVPVKAAGKVTPDDNRTIVCVVTDVPITVQIITSLAAWLTFGSLVAVIFKIITGSEPDLVGITWTFLLAVAIPVSMLLIGFGTIKARIGNQAKSLLNILATSLSLEQLTKDALKGKLSKNLYPGFSGSGPGLLSIASLALHLLPFLVGAQLALTLADGLYNIAWNDWCKGNYKRSEQLCRSTLFLTQWALGDENKEVAHCRYIVAECCRCQRKSREAEELYKQSIAQQTKATGKNNPMVAWSHDNLGRVYDQQGKPRHAIHHYDKALKIWAESKYDQDPLIARCKNRKALALLKGNQAWKAETTQLEVIEIDKRVFKKHCRSLWNKTIAADLNDLGVIKHAQKRLADAELLYKDALNMKTNTFGADHYSTGITLYNLSILYRDRGDKQKQRAFRDKAMAVWAKYLPDATSRRASDDADVAYMVMEKSRPDYEYPNMYTRYDAVRSHYYK